MQRVVKALLCSVLLAVLGGTAIYAHGSGEKIDPKDCGAKALYCAVANDNQLQKALQDFPAPELTPPNSLIAATPIKKCRAVTQSVTYSVATRGTITADLSSFKSLANATLNDTRGWRCLGLSFKEVASGGQFTLVLSQAAQVPSFGSPCDSQYSCQTGGYVIINQDRWQGATAPWNSAGGDLRNYRHMVVNHETGHWLGHGHEFCGGAKQAAPVMQQQSISLQNCKFNPWPLASEMWSSRLGI